MSALSTNLSYQGVVDRLTAHPTQKFILIINENETHEGIIQQVEQFRLKFTYSQGDATPMIIESEEIDYPHFNYTGPCHQIPKIQIFVKKEEQSA